MTEPNDLAFAHHEVWDNEHPEIGWIGGGLTKREYFSAMAFAGMNIGDSPPDKAAEWAVEYADALILALNKDGK